jgi:hypothetical protein
MDTRDVPRLPVPAAPPKMVERTVELSLPEPLMKDLEAAAEREGVTVDTAVEICIALWRDGTPSPVTTRVARRKRSKP